MAKADGSFEQERYGMVTQRLTDSDWCKLRALIIEALKVVDETRVERANGPRIHRVK